MKTFLMEIADNASHILVFSRHDDRGFSLVGNICLSQSASHAKVSVGVDEGVENPYFRVNLLQLHLRHRRVDAFGLEVEHLIVEMMALN